MNFKMACAKVIFEDGLYIKLRFYKWYILNINVFVKIEEQIKSLGIFREFLMSKNT